MKKTLIIIFSIFAFMEIFALITGSIDGSIRINLTSVYIVLGILLSIILLTGIYFLSVNIYINIKYKKIKDLLKNNKYTEAYDEINKKETSKIIDQVFISQILPSYIDNDKELFKELLNKINNKKLIFVNYFWNTIQELSQENQLKAKEFYDLFNTTKVSNFYKKNYNFLKEILMAIFDKNFPEEKKSFIIFKIQNNTIKSLLKNRY